MRVPGLLQGRLITLARRAAPKGQYQVCWPDKHWAMLGGCEVLLVLPLALNFETAYAICTAAKSIFGSSLWLTVELMLEPMDALLQCKLEQLAKLTGVALVASGNVHMHVRSRKPLQDVITAVRQGVPVSDCGFALQLNAETHLRSRERLGRLYRPGLLAATLTLAARCSFSLDELRYQYPVETVLPGLSPAQTLRRLTLEGASQG